MKWICKIIYAGLGSAALLSPALAQKLDARDPRAALTPGLYQAGPNGCAHPSGVGTMTFDGRNFSGNHQFCKTTATDQKDQYRLECVDLMGGKKTEADVDSDPDKTIVTLAIKITSKRAFSIGGDTYDYCGGLK